MFKQAVLICVMISIHANFVNLVACSGILRLYSSPSAFSRMLSSNATIQQSIMSRIITTTSTMTYDREYSTPNFVNSMLRVADPKLEQKWQAMSDLLSAIGSECATFKNERMYLHPNKGLFYDVFNVYTTTPKLIFINVFDTKTNTIAEVEGLHGLALLKNGNESYLMVFPSNNVTYWKIIDHGLMVRRACKPNVMEFVGLVMEEMTLLRDIDESILEQTQSSFLGTTYQSTDRQQANREPQYRTINILAQRVVDNYDRRKRHNAFSIMTGVKHDVWVFPGPQYNLQFIEFEV
eukprot:216076_1